MIDDWINKIYLDNGVAQSIRESVLAKPWVRYAVLDNFFREDKLNILIEEHKKLQFNEPLDRTVGKQWLPYDGSVVFAKDKINYGYDLFFDEEWHQYLSFITATSIKFPTNTEVKLRWHKPHATGFWIHTDSVTHSLVAICYFNKDWKYSDGGVLQLWKEDQCFGNVFSIESPDPFKRLDFLTCHKRIRTSTPGGGFANNMTNDLLLLDQIVPAYNRLFVCNYQYSKAYHSVTPSNGRERTGFVQWI